MTPFMWAQLVLSSLMFLGVVFLLPIVSHLRQLRTNDIQHLEAAIQGVSEQITRVEQKLDAHVRWHLDQHGS